MANDVSESLKVATELSHGLVAALVKIRFGLIDHGPDAIRILVSELECCVAVCTEKPHPGNKMMADVFSRVLDYISDFESGLHT